MLVGDVFCYDLEGYCVVGDVVDVQYQWFVEQGFFKFDFEVVENFMDDVDYLVGIFQSVYVDVSK